MNKELKGMIGLEIHTYILSKEKLFCRCRASREKGLRANVNICPICTGQPGAKPMLANKTAVEKAVQIALMLGCKINEKMVWQRKHYDWPDLPKGYQNTLSGPYASPVGVKGKFMGIRITEMHLEEDPAAWEPSTGCVDYNRSGLPLVEIVTEPDFSTAEEAVDWLKKLIHGLAYLKAADSNAGIKADVNVSIPKKTVRVEIKNISSLESIEKAINYELERQAKEGSVLETRRWDDIKGKTVVMRSKENAEDYRFISDPDLQDIVIEKKMVSLLESRMPESPDVKLEKLIKKYKINKKDAEVLAKNIDVVEFFEKVAEEIGGEFAVPWVTVELLRFLNYNKKKLHEVEIDVKHFIALLNLVKLEKITELKAKEILNKFFPKSFMPSAGGEGKISDVSELKKVALKVISENAKAVADYKAGEKNSFNFLVGKIMEATKKRADFKIARAVLEKELKGMK